MGGYAIYVWSAYGVTLVLMFGLLLLSWSGAKTSERSFEKLRREARPDVTGRRKTLTARRPDRPREIQNTTP